MPQKSQDRERYKFVGRKPDRRDVANQGEEF